MRPENAALTLRQKLIYGLGDWGTSAATTVRNIFWFFFLTSVVGLDAALAGSVFLVGRIWDAINDPLIGMFSDRVRTRWGRRRPFLLFGALPFGLSFVLLFLVPPWEQPVNIALYYIFAFILFDSLYTIINVPYSALMPELTQDYDERSSLAGWRIAVSILAALVTGGLFKYLAEEVFGAWLGGGVTGLRAGYALSASLWGLTIALPYFIVFREFREEERAPVRSGLHPWRTFRQVFANRAFRLAALIYLLTFTTVDIVLVVFIRFLIDYVRVEPGFDNVLLATVLGLALVTMPLTVTVMRRLGKRHAYMVSMGFLAVVLAIMSQVPPGGQTQVLIAGIFAGLGYGAANTLPWAIVADVIEADELESGERREGVYYGYLVFFRKLAAAIAIFTVGQVLDAAGFVSSVYGSAFIAQPPAALLAMRFFVGYVPPVMLLFAIIVAWRFPLDRASYNAIRRQLSEREQHE
jgi:glycoside/pentoside/hexuronide:cation symporter, GPH family